MAPKDKYNLDIVCINLPVNLTHIVKVSSSLESLG